MARVGPQRHGGGEGKGKVFRTHTMKVHGDLVVSFTPRPLYLRYPLNWRSVGPQCLSGLGCFGILGRSVRVPLTTGYASVDEGFPVSSHRVMKVFVDMEEGSICGRPWLWMERNDQPAESSCFFF